MKSTKHFTSIGILAAINFALVFVFQWYLLVYFGAGEETDIFFGTLAAPQFIFLVLSGSLSMVLIPILSPLKRNEFQNESWLYLYAISFLFLLIGIIALATVQFWIPLLLPGFDGQKLATAIEVSKVQLITMVLNAALSVLISAHYSRENYVKIELSGIVSNLLAFAILFLSVEKHGIFAAVWATVARVASQIAYLFPILGRARKPVFKNSTFPVSVRKIKPLLLGNTYYKTDILVDRYLTSKLVAGDLTLFNFAQQIYGAVNTILIKVFINTMVPPMAKASNEDDMKKFNRILNNRLIIVFVVIMIAGLMLWLAGLPLLGFVLSYRNLSMDSIEKLWKILLLLFGFFAGGILGSLTSSAFMAKLDTKTPTVIGSILFTIYLPIKILVFFKYGIIGLAISISIYYLVSFGIQWYFLSKTSVYFSLNKDLENENKR